MKLSIIFLIFIFIVPGVFADITVKTGQNIYNLGNKITASASVLQGSGFEGLFKLTLSCGNYKLDYFLTPVILEANFRTAINVPDLGATPSMLGNCFVDASLLTNENLIIERKESNSFIITDQLAVLPIKSKLTALPAESLEINGVINEAFGNNALRASALITLDNNSYNFDAVDGRFNFTLQIPRSIKSGKHIVGISTSDKNGNLGSMQIELEITAIPAYIKTDLSNDKLLPGSKVEITSSLYDQADDLVNASLDLELISPKGDKVFRKVVQSSERTDYEFSQYAEPGIYVLTSSYNNLLIQKYMNITAIKGVKIRYTNETVVVENMGNIPFEDELTFILESGLKKYPITKKIRIEPGKILSFDLSKEVPLGVYDVIVPIKEGFDLVKDKFEETIGSVFPAQESILADDVIIHDNRPIHKKVAEGLTSVTSFLVGADGIIARNPLLAPIILIIIISLIVIRYGRKPLMNLIKRKKDKEESK